MSVLRSGLVGVCCLVVSLFAGSAKANCQAFLAPYFQHAQGSWTSVGFSYVSMQGSGAVGYATSAQIGPGAGMLEVNAQGNLDSRVTSWSYRTRQLFSDRFNGTQPFSVNSADSMDLVVSPSGTVWLISNTWGVTATISNTVCANNVLYGWGPSIANYAYDALYIFRFFDSGYIG
ncbi:hypothetical protein ACN28E_38750 [Archangium lansingense]|uniref:hypothetical protein n=1 Tax=Archangium lansingense TaxID=2995310 RepID=UPI003B7B8964